MRSFDLRLLESFVVLADEGLHVRGAAERLGIGQSGLSQRMARLQRQLGTSLIVRGERRNRLTPAGARFLTHARAILRRAGRLSAELHAASDTLRIHMGVGAHHGARELVTSFMAAHPSVRVEIVDGPSSDARHALLRQAVDAAFELRTGCPPEMRFEPVDRSPLGPLTGLEHPVARGTASMLTGRALFEPLPPGLTWTASTPHRHPDFGMMWDPRRSTRSLARFVAYVRERAEAAAAPPVARAAAPDPVAAGPARNTGDVVVSRLGFDLRLLLPFVTVAEEMHFGRAAERLMTAQPALSRQVARLESQLGAQLVVRSTRAMELTEAGHLTVAAARDIIDRACRAQISAGAQVSADAQVSAGAETAVTGRLDVRSSDTAHPALVRLLASFRTSHPVIAVRVRDSDEHTTVDALADGTGDIGVCSVRVALPGLRRLKFADVEQGLRCVDTHPLAHRESVRWSDLNGAILHVPAPGVAATHHAWLRAKLVEHGVTVREVRTLGIRAPTGMADEAVDGAVAVTARYDVGVDPHLTWVPFDPPECIEQEIVWNDDTANPAVRSFLVWFSSELHRPQNDSVMALS